MIAKVMMWVETGEHQYSSQTLAGTDKDGLGQLTCRGRSAFTGENVEIGEAEIILGLNITMFMRKYVM